MARRPAYNTHAERARRAVLRDALLGEIAAAGDRADELVPAMAAWVQTLRREGEHEAMFGRPYDRYARVEPEMEGQVRAMRDHVEMAWIYAYAARAAREVGALLDERASAALLAATSNARSACPYSEAELAIVTEVYSEP